MLSRKWQRRFRFWALVVLLGVLGGVVSFGLLRFLDAFYAYVPTQYEPKDTTRENVLEKDVPGRAGR